MANFFLRGNKLQNYTIFVLGPTASGKTVFLASMYHELSVSDTGFFLRADDPEQQEELINLYSQIIDTSQDFPNANLLADTKEYQFTCCVKSKSKGAIYPVLRFTYFDYAGERMKKLYNPATNTFALGADKELKKADILLAIIDGQRLLPFMRRENYRLITESLEFVLPILQNSTIPVHFIITKWDLLEGLFSLEDIIHRLGEHLSFRKFVDASIEYETIRLIPVSAVGTGFSTLQGGIMKKLPGALPNPFQVEMPLICVLPDQFKHQIEHLDTGMGLFLKRLLDFAEPIGKNVFSWIIFLVIQIIIGLLFTFLTSHISLGASIAGQFPQWTPLPRLRTRNREQAFLNQRKALNHTISRFLALMTELENRFPASNLSKYCSEQKSRTQV
jgi:hypothetical protein